MAEKAMPPFFGTPLNVVNVGLRSFAESLQAQGVPVTEVDWRPSPVPRHQFTGTGADIDAANAEATRRIMQGRPMLVGMGIARQTIPGYHDRLILHAGPPITWQRMCGPQRGAVVGALVYEGLAQDEEEAAVLAASGEIEFAPCHHYHAVGPMAGIISPSMPVFVIKNETFGSLAFATQNEGLGAGPALRGLRVRRLRAAALDGRRPLPHPQDSHRIAGRGD